MRSSDNDNDLIGTAEAGEIIGVSRVSVAKLCEDGTLVGAHRTRPGTGGHWRIPRVAVVAYRASTRPHKRAALG